MKEQILMFSKVLGKNRIWDKFLMQYCKDNFPEFKNITVKTKKVHENTPELVEEPKINLKDTIPLDEHRHLWGDKGHNKKWCLPTILLDLKEKLGYMPHPKQLIKPSIKSILTETYDALDPSVDEQLIKIFTEQKDDPSNKFLFYLGLTEQGEFTQEVLNLFQGKQVPDVRVERPNPGFHYQQLGIVDKQLLTEETPIRAFLQIYKNRKVFVNTENLTQKKKIKEVDLPMQL